MTTKLMSKTLKAINKRIEDVLLKSRMREIFKSGSVRGLIVTLGLVPHQKVRYGLYSTEKQQISELSVNSVVDQLYNDLHRRYRIPEATNTSQKPEQDPISTG